MPLTLEQFKALKAKGLSPQQIASFEAGNKPGSFPKQNPDQRSFYQKFSDYLDTPAYDMAQNNSGVLGTLAKESANIAKSGGKFVKGAIDFLNPVNTFNTLKQIPGQFAGYASDINAAYQSEKNAQQLEAKAKALTGKNPVAPQTNLNQLK